MKNVVDSLDIVNEMDSDKLRKYTKEVLQGYNIKDNEDVIENKEEYINAFEKYTEKYIESNSHIFENYMVNFIYNNLFPFSKAILCLRDVFCFYLDIH